MNVLIVDDEKLGRESLRSLLSMCGFNVHAASNIEQATDVAKRVTLDAAVIDWMLGDATNGCGVADAVLEIQPDTRIVIISGHLDVQLDAQHETQYAFLMKPFQLCELLAVLPVVEDPKSND